MPRGAATLAALVGAEMEKGKPLDEAIAAQRGRLPEFYTAVVAAGARSGRLTSALEVLSEALARIDNLRRRVVFAFAYPLAIVAAAWMLLVAAARYLAPTFDWIELSRKPLIDALRVEPSAFWALLLSVPIVLLVFGLLHYFISTRANRSFATGMWLADRLPGVRGVCRLTAQAQFTELLYLLTAHHTPLPEALRLSADAVGWNQLTRPAGALGTELERGEPLKANSKSLGQLPPLVRLSLLAGDSPERLSRSLWHAADAYHERANCALDSLSFYLPAVTTAAIGGTAVAVYALLTLGPYFQALGEIGNWTS